MFTFKKTDAAPLEGIELYARRGVDFAADAPLAEAGTYTVAAKFIDAVSENASISVNGRSAAAIAGWTMCNTGKERLGAFVWEAREEDIGKIPVISVRGIPTLTKLTLSEGRDEEIISAAKALRVRPDEIKVPFELERGMQLVCTVGELSPSCARISAVRAFLSQTGRSIFVINMKVGMW